MRPPPNPHIEALIPQVAVFADSSSKRVIKVTFLRVSVLRASAIYSLSKFPVYNTVLLTPVIIQSMTSKRHVARPEIYRIVIKI